MVYSKREAKGLAHVFIQSDSVYRTERFIFISALALLKVPSFCVCVCVWFSIIVCPSVSECIAQSLLNNNRPLKYGGISLFHLFCFFWEVGNKTKYSAFSALCVHQCPSALVNFHFGREIEKRLMSYRQENF